MLQVQDGNLLIDGHIDRFRVEQFSMTSLPKSHAKVKIDLSAVKSVDTAGLAWLLSVVEYYQNQNIDISIDQPPAKLISLANLSNVLGLLPLTVQK